MPGENPGAGVAGRRTLHERPPSTIDDRERRAHQRRQERRDAETRKDLADLPDAFRRRREVDACRAVDLEVDHEPTAIRLASGAEASPATSSRTGSRPGNASSGGPAAPKSAAASASIDSGRIE